MPKKILIVGYGTAGKSLAASLKKSNQKVEGCLDDSSTGARVLGTLTQVNDIVKQHGITDIYFAIPTASAAVVRDFVT